MDNNGDKRQIPQISEDFMKPEVLDNFRRPNIQFIRRAKQLSPRANELVVIFEKLRDTLKIKNLRSISTRTGSGFFINTANFDIKNFNRDNIIEIIDFDPVRNNMMVIGNEPPASDAALHWFIYRGLPTINGVISIENSEIFERFQKSTYPLVDSQKEIMDTNLALKILKCAKTSEITLLSGQGIMVVGRTASEAYNSFMNNLEKFSKQKRIKKVKSPRVKREGKKYSASAGRRK